MSFPNLEDYRRLSTDEVEDAVYMAALLNIHHLPQLKGPGKPRGTQVRETGIKMFAQHMAQTLFQNRVLLQGPPSKSHSAGGGPSATPLPVSGQPPIGE